MEYYDECTINITQLTDLEFKFNRANVSHIIDSLSIPINFLMECNAVF